MIHVDLTHPCYGCGVCVSACPHNAIQLKMSNDGFWLPDIDKNRCTECNICEKVCAHLDTHPCFPKEKTQISGYSIINNDPQIREQSTSGGASFAIASYLHDNGYKLVGVKYDTKNNIAKHFVADTLDEFRQSMNSKYIQSFTSDGFDKLKDGNRYAIFGTPCQIDSLRRWAKLRHKENNFIFIDLFCHGVPSYLLWSSYLKYHIRSTEKLIKPIFRDKQNGWHTYTLTLKTDRKNISHTLSRNDLFYNFFLESYILNIPCYKCIYRDANSAADIRMGDLWGDKYHTNNEGITGILALTDRGRKIIQHLNQTCTVTHETIETVIGGQMHHNLKIPRLRNKLILKLQNDIPLNKLYLIYGCRMRIKHLIPNKIKSMVKHLIR